jgi:histidine triad (HIT) family protein
MLPCIFCDISQKKVSSYIIYEDKHWIVFLDHKPLFFGHCLLIPKIHAENIFDLPDNLGTSFINLLKRVGSAIQKAVGAQGLFIANNNKVSQSVPHFHVHLVPRSKGDGLKGFFWPRVKYKNEDDILSTQNAIRAYLNEKVN